MIHLAAPLQLKTSLVANKRQHRAEIQELGPRRLESGFQRCLLLANIRLNHINVEIVSFLKYKNISFMWFNVIMVVRVNVW